MKILLVLGKYLPEKNGGIENYSHTLGLKLLQQNHHVDVAILESTNMERYTYEGIYVIPLRNGFTSFSSLLSEMKYDICHFHEYSAFGGIELFWFKEAKHYCKKIFFTFHLPYLTCYKADFRYMGITDCNDFFSPPRCVDCIIATRLHYKDPEHFNLRNMGIKLAIPLLKKSARIGQLEKKIQSGATQLTELINVCDTVFLIADWFREILYRNGYNSPKLKKIPPITVADTPKLQGDTTGLKRRILFAGRIESQKGLHLLCKAMNRISTKDIEVDVYGNIVDDAYYTACINEYGFNYKETLLRHQLISLFPLYDFLVLPSVFTEMYSMVLQEAFNMRLPVIVSGAKGNKAVVNEGRNGFIFKYNDGNDLARVIDKAYTLMQSGHKFHFETPVVSEEGTDGILSYYS